MKNSLILLIILLTVPSCVITKSPEQRCLKAGILIESMSIEHHEVGSLDTIKTYIECRRLP